jgi:hypothetical protein
MESSNVTSQYRMVIVSRSDFRLQEDERRPHPSG